MRGGRYQRARSRRVSENADRSAIETFRFLEIREQISLSLSLSFISSFDV